MTTFLVHLPDPDPAGIPGVSADKKLFSVRTQFANRVSEWVLKQLLDKLLECQVITHQEMEGIAAQPNRADKARTMIDTVQRKGRKPSSALIAALRDVDPCLSKQLN